MITNVDTTVNDKQQSYSLTKGFIEQILDIYESDFRFILSANELTENSISLKVRVDHYPYTKSLHFHYVTATSISLLVSQAVYVFIAHLIKSNRFTEMSLAKFIELRDNGNLLFTRQKYTYRKKVPLRTELDMTIQLKASKETDSFFCGQIEFDVNGYMSGDSMIVASK